MVMFVWGTDVYFQITTPPGERDGDLHRRQALDVEGAAHQRAARDQRAARAGGQPVKLIIGSEDVLHSYYIPAFRVKMDAVPGRYTTMWFEATKAGSYHLLCAEFCGMSHSKMIGKVVAMAPRRLPGVARRRTSGRVAAPTPG